MIMSHLFVNVMACPSVSDKQSGFYVGCLLWTGVPCITKICVAPELAMASLVSRVTVAAKARHCVKSGDIFDKFEVMTVSPS
jgi:hypothetical protein